MPVPSSRKSPVFSRWLVGVIGVIGFVGLVAGALQLGGCTPAPKLPPELATFYQQMQDNAQRFPRDGGAWLEHFGDAPYYGLAFYVHTDGNGAIASAARDHNIETLRHAQTEGGWFLENLEETMMSTLGLIEYVSVTGDRAPLPDIEATIDTINALTLGLRRYIDIDAGMFAIRTYGPTAITAAIGLLNVQYASLLAPVIDPARGAASVDFARDIVATIDEKAWDGHRYRIKPGDDLLELYPNTMMMLVLARLYIQTGDSAYRERAEAAYRAIAPLRSARGGYRSPYSAQEMGAKTDDYSTLSSQNYLTLALAVMYEATGEQVYFDEAMFVFDFVRTHLYDPATGHLLHHWIDGRIAVPTDPEYFCTGCNFQFIYAIWYLQNNRVQS